MFSNLSDLSLIACQQLTRSSSELITPAPLGVLCACACHCVCMRRFRDFVPELIKLLCCMAGEADISEPGARAEV